MVNELCSSIRLGIMKIQNGHLCFGGWQKKEWSSFLLSMKLTLSVIIHDWIELQWCANSWNKGFWISFMTERKWASPGYHGAKKTWWLSNNCHQVNSFWNVHFSYWSSCLWLVIISKPEVAESWACTQMAGFEYTVESRYNGSKSNGNPPITDAVFQSP